MKVLIRLAFAVSVSLIVAFILSRLPEKEQQLWKQGGHPVAVPGPAIRFSDANLVDFIAKLPLTQEIGRVDWHHSILVMDLYAGSPSDRETVYADLLTLCRSAFERTMNIEEVMVRIVDSHTERLVLSLEMAREEWQAEKSIVQSDDRQAMMEMLERYLVKISGRSL